jgi:mono/diheme cytochrome c family protein
MKFSFRTIAAAAFCLAIALPNFVQAANPTIKSAEKGQVAHGEYLVKGVAGCADCHTPRDNKGEPVADQWLKGAKLSFAPLAPFPGWASASPDITGVEGWDTEKAVHFLMTGLDPSGRRPRAPMPQFRMNRTDAEAVVAYLKSLK